VHLSHSLRFAPPPPSPPVLPVSTDPSSVPLIGLPRLSRPPRSLHPVRPPCLRSPYWSPSLPPPYAHDLSHPSFPPLTPYSPATSLPIPKSCPPSSHPPNKPPNQRPVPSSSQLPYRCLPLALAFFSCSAPSLFAPRTPPPLPFTPPDFSTTSHPLLESRPLSPLFPPLLRASLSRLPY
jgi:hypothetical protein